MVCGASRYWGRCDAARRDITEILNAAETQIVQVPRRALAALLNYFIAIEEDAYEDEHDPVIATPIVCEVVKVHDGDGPLWCSNGTKIRIAGIQAPDFKNAEPCRRPDGRRANYTCDNRAAERSQRIVSALTLGRRLVCLPQGKSYSRVVARCTLPDGRSLSCAVIAAGAAIRWDRYWRQYRMGSCQ